MSILDDNYIERTDKLFLLGRWLPLTPYAAGLQVLRYPFVNGPIGVSASYAEKLCSTLFGGRLTLYELWELIGGIEVSPDWVSNWKVVAQQTVQEDMVGFCKYADGELIQKIANELIKRFSDDGMHIMSKDEFDALHLQPHPSMYKNMGLLYKKEDWFCYEPGILLHANWFESPAYIKIMMTDKGMGFGLLYGCVESIPRDVRANLNEPFATLYESYYECDLFVLNVSPAKSLLDKPRDFDEFMTHRQTAQDMRIRYNNFNQY